MNVFIEKDNRSLNFTNNDKISGRQLLNELGINQSSIILVKNDEVILEDEILEEHDEIKILSVISGG